MNNIQIAYHPDIIGKPEKVGKWRNEFINSTADLSIDDVIELVAGLGAATSYVLKDDTITNGRSHDSNIMGANVVMLDFDNTSSLEEIQTHPWYKHSAFAYTTPSFGKMQDDIDTHKLPVEQYEVIKQKVGKPKENFRLVFVFEDFVSADILLKVIQGLLSLFPMADQQCSDLARMIYGCKDATVIRNNAKVSGVEVEYLKELGANFRTIQKVVAKSISNKLLDTLEGDISIKLSDGFHYSISELFATFPRGFKSACYSPFRTEDNPSAFVRIFEDTGNVFVHDSGSGHQKTWFAKDYLASANGLALVKKADANKINREKYETLVIPIPYEETGILSIEHINERYVPSDLYYELNSSGIIFIKSPKGTGKTELLKTLVERVRGEKGSCLLIGHRVALLNNLSTRIGLDNYQEEDPSKFFAISVDSLMKIAEENTHFLYDTLIIDEVEQVLNHFKSDTLRKKRKFVFKQFINKIRAAKRIILLDADVSPEITIELIRLIRGNEQWASDDKQGFINEYQPGIGRTVNMYQSKEQMIVELCALLSDDPTANAFVITNSKTFTKELEQLITGLNLSPVPVQYDITGRVVTSEGRGSHPILVIHSDNSMQDEQQAFIEHPQLEGIGYRVIISSPTISTGVSIDGKHFGHVYGFFNDTPFTFYDCDQAISRVRNTSAVLNVWMPEKDTDVNYELENKLIDYGKEIGLDKQLVSNIVSLVLNNNEEYIENQIFNTSEVYREIELTTRRLSLGNDTLSDDETMWIRFLSTLDVITVDRMRNRKLKYIQYIESNGFSAVDIEADDIDIALGKSFMKANKINASEAEIIAIFEAPIIDYEEYLILDRNKHIASKTSQSDFYKRRRFEIAEWLGKVKVDLNPDTIRTFIKNELFIKHIRLKHVLLTESEIKQLDKEERERGKKAIGDLGNRMQIKELLNMLCALIGIGNDFHDFYEHEDDFIDISSEQLAVLCESVIGSGKAQDLKSLNKLLGGTKLTKESVRFPKKVWDAVFGYVGIDLISKRKKINGVPTMTYKIDLKKCQCALVHSMIEVEKGSGTQLSVNSAKSLLSLVRGSK